MILLCCSLASSSLTLRNPYFCQMTVWTLGMYSVWWFLLITMPSGLRFQKRFSWKLVGSKSWHSFLCSFTQIVASTSAAFSISDSLLHIFSNSCCCHNAFILLSLSGVTNLSLIAGVCAACMLAYRYLQDSSMDEDGQSLAGDRTF